MKSIVYNLFWCMASENIFINDNFHWGIKSGIGEGGISRLY